MIIILSDRDIPATLQEQSAKVVEEWQEFTLAQIGKPDLEHVAEEAFDLMEALVRWMGKAGIDVEAANQRHLEKMRRREACGR